MSLVSSAILVLGFAGGVYGRTCSGSADPAVTAAQCYSGSAGALGVTESIHLKIDDFAAPSGHLELTGAGIKSLNCSKHSFTKSGQTISVDLSDCLPSDVSIESVEYCSDQDAISVTVKDKSVLIPITAQLTRVDCPTMEGEAPLTCSRSADPIVKAAQCYAGSAGALGVKENIHVKIDAFAAPKGDLELTGDGIKSLSCSKHSFTKSGQQITTDLSDCLPSDVTVRSIKYCSDQDTISVTVKDKSVFIPITAQLKRVPCASDTNGAACTGNADPTVSTAQCYSGSAGALGVKESIHLKVDDFTSPNGDLELTGSGIKTLSCSKHAFTKSGQDISTDLSDCLPSDVAIKSVKYCSDQDAISVTVKDKSVFIPITAQLTRMDCPTMEAEAPFTCSGSADPILKAAQCYAGSAGALGVKENVHVKIDDFTAPRGDLELTGDGIKTLSCSKHSFTKSGQQISTDLSDCLPTDVAVSSVKYCSDQDAISVTVKDKSVPLPITALLTRVDCATAQTLVV